MTVQRMTNDKMSSEEMKQQMVQYDEQRKRTFDAQSANLTRSLRDVHQSCAIDPEHENPDIFNKFTWVIDDARSKHVDDEDIHETDVTSDPYIGREDNDGTPVGIAHTNPLLDSRKY